MADEQKPPIMNQKLGDLIQQSPHAQELIMKSMNIGPQQLQEMLKSTGNNQMMNMTIGDLFKNGVMQQAMNMSQGLPVQGQGAQLVTGQAPVNGQPGQGMPIQGGPMMIQGMPAMGQAVQVSKEQFQQILGMMQNGGVQGMQQVPGQMVQMGPLPVQQGSSGIEMPGQNSQQGQNVQGQNMIPFQMPSAEPQKQSFLEKLKNLFK